MNTIDSFKGTYAFLSNFYPAKVTYNGYTYQTSEHAFQAAKTTNKTDHDHIANAITPGIAKRRGRKVKCRPDWKKVRDTIMAEVVYYKFDQNSAICAKLKATDNAILIEGNWWRDIYWGVCRGVGRNMLGKILMIVRNIV